MLPKKVMLSYNTRRQNMDWHEVGVGRPQTKWDVLYPVILQREQKQKDVQ